MIESVDWTVIGVITLVIFLPILLVFLYLGYRRYLQHERQRLNDELILKLAREGQTLTPDLINTIRKEEKKDEAQSSGMPANFYEKLCTGGALILGGLIVLIRNRSFALIMIIFGLFLAAQGLALYLSCKNENENENHNA